MRSLLLLALLPLPAFADLTLSKSLPPIILHADGWKQSAWYDWGGHAVLARFLPLVLDADVPVLPASKLTPALRERHPVRIWVGRQPELDRALGEDLARLDDDAFILRVIGNDVYIAGKHWWGTNWAAHAFLERFADCRWFGPEPEFWKTKGRDSVGLFDVVPQLEKVSLPAVLNVVEEPSYRMRYFRFMPLHSFRLRYRDSFHHALVGIIPPAKYGKTNPEYFPLINGQRRVPESGRDFHFQPCVSNPAVVHLVANAAIDHFRKTPASGSFSVGMNDTNAFCECDACLAIAPPGIQPKEHRIAYAFFDFYNRIADRVAKDFPDKRLGCLAYAGLGVLPPGSIKLHPMIVPYITRDSAQLFDPNEQKEFADVVRTWQGLATRTGIYEYLYGGGFAIPRIYNRYLADNIKTRYGTGVDGFYAEAYPNFGLDGPKYWLTARLLWDHKQDPKALLDEYYTKLFGPAAAEVRAYFDLLEETWCTQTLKSNRSNYRWFLDAKQLEIFPAAVCDKAHALLSAAETKTTDELILRRIAFFKNTFAVTRSLSRRYEATAALDALMAQKDATPLPARLTALQTWLDAPKLADALKHVPPGALDTNVTPDLTKYDRQPVDAVARTVKEIVARATDNQANLIPAAVAERIDAKFTTDAAASTLLKSLAHRAVLTPARAETPPTIDGTIADNEWPAPAFAGHFHPFNRLDERPEKTTVHAAADATTLYLAFDLQQDPSTVGGNVTTADTGGWQKPQMADADDSISLTFTGNGPHRSIRVNPHNAVGQHTAKWPGVVKNSVTRKTPTGWQLELAIDRKTAGLTGKTPVTLAIARYVREQSTKPNQPPTWKAIPTTLLPAPPAGGIIGQGNHPQLMTFVTGARLILPE